MKKKMIFIYIQEYNHPHILLQNDNGHFASLVKETGTSMSDLLRKVAYNAYKNKFDDEEL